MSLHNKVREVSNLLNSYIVLDIETTGINPEFAQITEIGALKIIEGQLTETFSQLIDPRQPIPSIITEITGIDDVMVKGMPVIEAVLPSFLKFCEALPIMGHNLMFDYSFIKTHASRHGLVFEKFGVDTLLLAKVFMKDEKSKSLTNLVKLLGIHREQAHRAFDDALATYKLYCYLFENFYNEKNKDFFKPRPLYYRPKKVEPITPRQISYLGALLKKHQEHLEKPILELSKSEASRLIDQLIFKHGK